jgi:hypothetical protein
MNGLATLSASDVCEQPLVNFSEDIDILHTGTRENLKKLLEQRLNKMSFDSEGEKAGARKWLMRESNLILQDWDSETVVDEKTISAWLTHLTKKFRSDQRKELTIINKQINYQYKNADDVLEVSSSEDTLKELLAAEIEDFSEKGKQVILNRALTRLRELKQSRETITKNRLKKVVKFAVEGAFCVVLPENYALDFFERTLIKEMKGFHKHKGKTWIRNEACQKFKELQPAEKTIENILTIIADAKLHRRKYNEERAKEIINNIHLQKAAREAVDRVIEESGRVFFLPHDANMGGEARY